MKMEDRTLNKYSTADADRKWRWKEKRSKETWERKVEKKVGER